MMDDKIIFSAVYIISILGIVNGFIFGLYLLFARIGRRNANILLGILFLIISFRMFRSWFILNHEFNWFLSLSAHILFFCAGPVLYNYFKVGIRGQLKINLMDFLFFIPMISIYIGGFRIIVFSTVATLFFYFVLSAKVFNDYYNVGGDDCKRLISPGDYKWYRNLLIIVFVILLAFGVNLTFRLIPYITGAITYSILVYAMVYHWNKQQNYRKKSERIKKYEKSILHESVVEDNLSRLVRLMELEKVYKDYSLNLVKLAGLLNISHHQLSQLINQKLNKKFNDYINEYRIREAKSLLSNIDYVKETVENIGYEAGFSNVSSFYSAFKKFANSSPSKYRKEHQ